jgi:thioredoxin 1
MSELKAVTDATFGDEVLNADLPVLVDFWAPWCGPCRQLTPVVEQLSAEHSDKIKFVALNTDENPVTSQTYAIAAIPTLKVYVNGEVVKTRQGAKPKPLLAAELSDFLV